MRDNLWVFRTEDIEETTTHRTFLGNGNILNTLRPHNPENRIVYWVMKAEAERKLWELYTMPIGTPEDRQLVALLLNHHARITGPYGERLFGHQAREPLVDRYGVGSTRPRLWVLGEQLNPRAREYPMPFGTLAGRAMLWPYVNPWHVRISNCLEPAEDLRHAVPRLQEAWQEMGEPFVLLLGNKAAKTYQGQNIIGYLEHPQSVWRFQHHLAPEWSAQFVHWQERAVEGIG